MDRLSGDWCIFQLSRGHRYSTDDLLVSWFGCRWAERRAEAGTPGSIRKPRPLRILDLGCGVGSVGMMAAWRFPDAELLGIEAQQVSVSLARRSLRFNGIVDRARVIHADLRDPAPLIEEGCFDLVFGSPPYLRPAAGTVSDRPQCGPCRFEERGGVEDYCGAGARALAPGGVFALIFTHRERARVLSAAEDAGLGLLRQRSVVTREGREPLLCMFAFAGPGEGCLAAAELPALVVRLADGRRSDEMQALRVEMGFPPDQAYGKTGGQQQPNGGNGHEPA